MKRFFLSSIFFLGLFAPVLLAQDQRGRVIGKVIDGDTKTIASATITLRLVKDSSVVKLGVAGKEGDFAFEDIGFGQYFVAISAVGHLPGNSSVFEVAANNLVIQLPTIELIPEPKALSAVVVTSKKPLIEVKAGKMVVNVDASPSNSGTNVLELLEKSPGISVDNDGNISLKGKQGVMVLIDGKPTYMSGADLAALLKSMQSNNVDQVEIMTNPPAKFDAAGNSGIINIKTKKGIIKGMNGSAFAGYTQGVYGRINAGANLNYRNDKLNIFGGYNAGTFEGFNRMKLYRKMYASDKTTLDRTIDQYTRQHFEGFYNNVKLGVDYAFNKKNIAGFVINGNFSDNKEDPFSNAKLRTANGGFIYDLGSNTKNDRNSSNITANFNYKHTFDSTGRELTADVDYGRYTSKNVTNLFTKILGEDGMPMAPDVTLRGNLPSYINIYSAKVDYLHPFRNGLKMEAGLKSSFVNTDNKVDYNRTNGGPWEKDDRSNHFLYEENINAAYAIFSKSKGKWDVNAGLRLENTIAKGQQVSNDSVFTRNYTNLFPNLGLSYAANEKNQFSFSYSRRLSRPNYNDLNPFVFFLDSLTYGQGNPYLQPQFTNNFELSHTFNRFFTTTVNYTRTTDIIAEMLKQNTEQNVTFQTKENFNSMTQWGLQVFTNIPVTKWWNANVYLNVFNNNYNGIYQGDQVEIQYTTLMSNINNSFTFKNGWGAELSGWYRSKSSEGLLIINGLGSLNAGITKQVLKKKGMIKIGVRDALLTQKVTGYVKYSDIDLGLNNLRDTRQFTLNFTYRFGKTNIAPERKRRTGAVDEQNRVGSGNN